MSYNLNYLEEISAGDKEFIADMLHDFIINTPETLKEVKSKIDVCDYDEIYKIVHRIIPSFDYVGADYIKESLRQIESYSKQRTNIEQIMVLYEKVKIESIELSNLIQKDFKIVA
jgi:HPt (histidine-containing phosphotransfer) domain-containing protein